MSVSLEVTVLGYILNSLSFSIQCKNIKYCSSLLREILCAVVEFYIKSESDDIKEKDKAR